ncbi:hypothetical protein DA075_34545 [Methylobacterium currus]|jgi:hypothetical protein|uniref:Uncharacterized protein n=2 Tax=Methylobacterium TaxID=407 RepID=A0A2R4WWM2_9HYPH|nr:hypothetical protein DA075_34545 [Methylobacterium currus]SFF81711.1 hypothetical protein SAMN04487844_15217 [Methylobacterium sp. yr596]
MVRVASRRMRPPRGRRADRGIPASREGRTGPWDQSAKLAAAPAKTPTRSYVVFESRFAQDLFCAVPTSLPIPVFLTDAGWQFRGTLGKRGFRPPGFRAAAARKAASRDGFYLFSPPHSED